MISRGIALAVLVGTCGLYAWGLSADGSWAPLVDPPGACATNDDVFRTEDGGCKDLATWIVWSENTENYGLWLSWDEADAYCQGLEEGGDVLYGDWALPSKDEMIDVAARNGTDDDDDGFEDEDPVDGMDNDGDSLIDEDGFSYFEWWGQRRFPYSQDTKGKRNSWNVNLWTGEARLELQSSQLFASCNRYAGPTGLQAEGISATEMEVSWDDNSDSEDGFEIERSLDQATWDSVDTVGPDVEFYLDDDGGSGLTKKTVYYYRVRALGKGVDVSPWSEVASGRTKNR